MCKIKNALTDLCSSVENTNQRINKVQHSCHFISNQVDKLNAESNQCKQSICDLKVILKTTNDDIFHLSKHMNEMQQENQRLYNEILYLQTRSIRINLLFSGIIDLDEDENTEDVLKSLIKNEVEIEDDLPIQVTHRLGPYRQSNQRS